MEQTSVFSNGTDNSVGDYASDKSHDNASEARLFSIKAQRSGVPIRSDLWACKRTFDS